jgi:LuxR family maltose regulon positive regulatory protein
LISSWLEKCKCPYAWVSLNDDDNELHSFLNCIYLSILKIHPDALKNFSRIVEVSELPPLKIISETLINDLDNISGEFVFVLDDYHLIHNQQIHELIDLILKYPPQDLHMVVIARRDPAFDLSSLRAHSRMNELRMSDLCFSSKEIAILFKHLLGADLKDETVDHLVKKTEGWITGLCLASLTVTQPKDTNLILQNLEGDVHFIADFLVNDVLQKQPEEMQKLLLLTAVLNRFSADLIDSLEPDEKKDAKHRISGRVFINWLLKSNMFIISLDDKNKWFRYHHLFQEMMQSQLILMN